MPAFRALDDLLLDRVFQPAVNALQARNPAALAALCYAAYLASIIALALADCLAGTLLSRAVFVGAQLTTACLLYAQALHLGGLFARSPNPMRAPWSILLMRMSLLTITLASLGLAAAFPRFLSLRQAISDGGWVAYVAGVYFATCEPAKPKPVPRTAPDALPHTA